MSLKSDPHSSLKFLHSFIELTDAIEDTNSNCGFLFIFRWFMGPCLVGTDKFAKYLQTQPLQITLSEDHQPTLSFKAD